MTKIVDRPVEDLPNEAVVKSASASKASPTQQVGDFYASGMDVERLTALGVSPVDPRFWRIAKSMGTFELADTLARRSSASGTPVGFAALVS